MTGGGSRTARDFWARTSFVGRAAELEELEGWLGQGARWVTLVGTTGVGKSRLAVELGERLRPECLFWCDLTHAEDAADVLFAVAEGMELPLSEDGGVDGAVEQVGRALTEAGGAWLVLDGLDGVLAHAADMVTRWLGAASRVVVLATARQPLAGPGELPYELGPLDPGDALALFRIRARAAHAEIEGHEESVQALVEQLGRLPLAVELAAAQAGEHSPRDIGHRLSERSAAALPAGAGPADPGGPMRAVLEGCWDLLSPVEQLVLAQSAVFRRELSLEAAERVIDLTGVQVLEVLELLWRKGLLRSVSGRHGLRFHLLETIRVHALAALDASGARAQVERRHARYRVEQAEALATSLPARGAAGAGWALVQVRADLLAACRRMEDEEPDLAARAAIALERLPRLGSA